MDPVVAEVLELLLDRPTLPGGGRLLCIDGPAGSGKTTLAGDVAAGATGARLSVEVLHMDDMYDGWSGLGDPLSRRLHDEVTGPFASGEPGSYHRYDWDRGEFAELHVVPVVDLLVLEGVGSGSRLLADHRTALVWVTAPGDLRVERAMARDRALCSREGIGWDDRAQRAGWERFLTDEAEHFAGNGLPDAADLRVDGTRRL